MKINELNLTWRDALIVFMKEKTKQLMKAGLFNSDLYFNKQDEKEILSWDEKICEKIFLHMLKIVNEGACCYGLSGYLCPFCLYRDFNKKECYDCAYSKNHGYCNVFTSDYAKVLSQCNNADNNIGYYLSEEFYVHLLNKLAILVGQIKK